jgi:hypothetical protein
VNSRNVTSSKVVAWGAIAGAILLAAGCSDIFGFERSGPPVECFHNSDCSTGFSCLENLCTTACQYTSDCQGNPGFLPGLVCERGRCVAPQDAGVGVGPGDAPSGNETGSDAPPGCGDTSTSVNNCGWCGHVCAGNNATWTCASSECVPMCNPGWGDCDGNPSNGCETDIAGNSLACGSCQKPDSATSVCESDVCENGVCAIGDQFGGACSQSQDPLGSLNAFNPSTIVGGQFWSGSGGRVTAIGITTTPGGASHAYLAIYEDSPGGPGIRHGAPRQVTLDGGTVEAPVPHTTVDHTDLNPNTFYWVMAVADGSLTFVECTGGATWAYGTLPFGVPPPVLSTSTVSFTVVPRDYSPSMYLKFAHLQ